MIKGRANIIQRKGSSLENLLLIMIKRRANIIQRKGSSLENLLLMVKGRANIIQRKGSSLENLLLIMIKRRANIIQRKGSSLENLLLMIKRRAIVILIINVIVRIRSLDRIGFYTVMTDAPSDAKQKSRKVGTPWSLKKSRMVLNRPFAVASAHSTRPQKTVLKTPLTQSRR
jgi:hypothetical protein